MVFIWYFWYFFDIFLIFFWHLFDIFYTFFIHFQRYSLYNFWCLFDIFLTFIWNFSDIFFGYFLIFSYIIFLTLFTKLSPSSNSSFSWELRWLSWQYYELDPAVHPPNHPVKYQIGKFQAPYDLVLTIIVVNFNQWTPGSKDGYIISLIQWYDM